jgi:hypothetical protein
VCGNVYRRVFYCNPTSFFQSHYNHSVGEFVTNRQQFLDTLKRKSDEQSATTGVEHNYQPVDAGDTRSMGVTDEGFDATAKRRHDHAIREQQATPVHARHET